MTNSNAQAMSALQQDGDAWKARAEELLESLQRLVSAVEFCRTMGYYKGGSFHGMGELDRAEQEARAAIARRKS